MMAVPRMLPLALLALVLVGCVSRPERPTAQEAAPVAADVDWSRAEQVDVILVDFSFGPSRIVLDHGRPYRLHLENRGSGGHNFDAPDFFRSAALRGAAAAALRDGKGAIELARGEAMAVAEDALVAALEVKAAHPEAAITYVRKQNARGDRRHPHPDQVGRPAAGEPG